MNINEILSGVDCVCGKHHTCAIESVYIEAGATARLGALCRDCGRILIVADENTYAAGSARVEESIATLMEALVVVGIMMSFASSSRPASGSEHHLSHFFEITGILENKPYFPHGIDVAYATVIPSSLREKPAKADFSARGFSLSRDAYLAKMKEVYGRIADGCVARQDKAGSYATDRTPLYRAHEAEIKDIFKKVPTAREMEDMLRLVGLDIQEFYATYGDKKIADAISYAKDLKDRYSVLWMYYELMGEARSAR